MSLQDQFLKFRKEWPSVNVMVESDYMSYKTKPGTADRSASMANELIEDLGLGVDLVAVPTNLSRKDSFIIRKKSNSV